MLPGTLACPASPPVRPTGDGGLLQRLPLGEPSELSLVYSSVFCWASRKCSPCGVAIPSTDKRSSRSREEIAKGPRKANSSTKS
jgi:hypothetical protein